LQDVRRRKDVHPGQSSHGEGRSRSEEEFRVATGTRKTSITRLPKTQAAAHGIQAIGAQNMTDPESKGYRSGLTYGDGYKAGIADAHTSSMLIRFPHTNAKSH
jgi:hypothetical protein